MSLSQIRSMIAIGRLRPFKIMIFGVFNFRFTPEAAIELVLT